MHRRMALVAVVVGLLAAAPTQASSVTYTGTIPLQLTNLVNKAPSPVLPKFDTNLGTLLSAEVTLRGFGDTTFTFTNTSDNNQTITASWTVDFKLTSTDPGINSLVGTLIAGVSGTTGSLTVGPKATVKYADTFDKSFNATYTSAGDLAKFIGTGDLGFRANTTAGVTYLGGGNLIAAQMTHAGADVSVTYTYAVPEPSSIALAATGLVALGGLAARRHRRKVASV